MMESEANYPQIVGYSGAGASELQRRRLDITLRQNIDERIKQAQAQVKELEETKDRMEASGILDMRIDDIQRAMRF